MPHRNPRSKAVTPALSVEALFAICARNELSSGDLSFTVV